MSDKNWECSWPIPVKIGKGKASRESEIDIGPALAPVLREFLKSIHLTMDIDATQCFLHTSPEYGKGELLVCVNSYEFDNASLWLDCGPEPLKYMSLWELVEDSLQARGGEQKESLALQFEEIARRIRFWVEDDE